MFSYSKIWINFENSKVTKNNGFVPFFLKYSIWLKEFKVEIKI